MRHVLPLLPLALVACGSDLSPGNADIRLDGDQIANFANAVPIPVEGGFGGWRIEFSVREPGTPTIAIATFEIANALAPEPPTLQGSFPVPFVAAFTLIPPGRSGTAGLPIGELTIDQFTATTILGSVDVTYSDLEYAYDLYGTFDIPR